MTTIIFAIKKSKLSLAKIYEELSECQNQDISVVVACEKNNPLVEEFSTIKTPKYSTKLIIFSVGTNDESMLESAIKQTPTTNIIVVRDTCQNFYGFMVDKLIIEGLLGNDVVMFKSDKKKSKIATFFYNLRTKLCRTFFNFNHYEGDIGIQYFSSQTHELLKASNVTLLSKLNRWVALNIKYIEAKITPTKFDKQNLKKPIIWTSIYGGLFICTIILAIILGSINLVSFMLYILAFIVEISLGIYCVLEMFNLKKVGALTCKSEDAVEIREISKK